jgi:hypothetical protein
MSRPRESLLAPSRVAAITVLASIPAKLLGEKLSDPDLWWHLKTGAIIAARHRIPTADLFSYSAPGRRWVVQEWGSELIMHWLHEAFGLYGILVWRAIMLLAVYLLVARLLVRRMGSGIGTWAFLALVAYAGVSNWTERPNLFSFLFVVVTLTLLDRKDRAIWWFVPLAALWANLHGMVILGVGLVAVVAGAEGLKAGFRWAGADGAWARRLGLVAVAGVAATTVNPAGPGLLLHSLRLVRTVGSLVTEWFSPNFHQVAPMLFLGLLVITIATLVLSPERPDPTDLALALAFTVLALQAARNLAVAAIVLGVTASRYLPGAVASVRRNAAGPRATAAPSRLFGAVALTVALGALGIIAAEGFPRSDSPAGIVERTYPIAALRAADRPGARIFAWDVWGDYLIYSAWPDVRVYHDTRVDMYGTAQTRRYARTIAALPGWRQTLDESCTTNVLVRPQQDPLAEVLRLTSDWRVEREDVRSVLFARVAPAPGCGGHPIP